MMSITNNNHTNTHSHTTGTPAGRTTTTTTTITFLRLMFVALSVTCLIQLSYHYGGGSGSIGGSSLLGCTTILYVKDGETGDAAAAVADNENGKMNEKNLRRLDLDAPMNMHAKKRPPSKLKSNEENQGGGGKGEEVVEKTVGDKQDDKEMIQVVNYYLRKNTTTTAEPPLPPTTKLTKSSDGIAEKQEEENQSVAGDDDNDDTIISKFSIDPLFQKEQDRIDNGISDEDRCKQFGVPVLPHDQSHKRRLFFGSMLANENQDLLIAHAIEVYNQYDVVSLVESNTTHFNTPRQLNYPEGSVAARTLLESEFFGSRDKTTVYIDYWLEDEPDLIEMQREVEQRNTIWKRWIAAGMQPNDIGIMADLDELVSRDFLNALQVCDFPIFQHDPHQRPDCQTPKMLLSTIQFESSPRCIKTNEWFHPDLILGNCLLGIGDNSGRVTPVREGSPHNGMKGERTDEWGLSNYNHYPQDVLDNKRFPLWDGRDIREVNGNKDGLTSYVPPYSDGHGTTAVYGTAFHLHNWFDSLEVLRHKYQTYGHALGDATTLPLSKIQDDLDTMVRCNRRLGNALPSIPKSAFPYYEINDRNEVEIEVQLDDTNTVDTETTTTGTNTTNNKKQKQKQFVPFGGNRPIYFRNTTYVQERNKLVSKLIEEDEAKYGSYYRTKEAQKQTIK